MSSFVDDKSFALSLVKGNLAEVMFERLAVHAGWWVQYKGDQYHHPISPQTKKVDATSGTPDFEIWKDGDTHLTVEVKYQTKLVKNDTHRKGKEDFRVVLSPEGKCVYPEAKASDLNISDQDWSHAVAFLKKTVAR
jgi:hypothetical protein